jgi:hypothetical protein
VNITATPPSEAVQTISPTTLRKKSNRSQVAQNFVSWLIILIEITEGRWRQR